MTQKDMRQLVPGLWLCLSLVLFPSCRTSKPAPLEICIGDGVGGADCLEADGTKLYRSPSMLLNYWMTSEADEAAFSSWCYNTSGAVIKPTMKAIKDQISVSHPSRIDEHR